LAIASSTYCLRSHLVHGLEEQEAQLDEIESTLRGHIRLIEDPLDQIERKRHMNKREELYGKRKRDEKNGSREAYEVIVRIQEI
ncbi:hypothetical protein P280DRAFT_387983, partial [Massarina eburnea CBS 473.64]